MAQDRLNFFSPFRSKPSKHEDQLTRALLVVLRLSPMAHEAWLRRVAPDRYLWRLPAATFETQHHGQLDVGEAKVISVYLYPAPDQPVSDEGEWTNKERGQVLDGVIRYEHESVNPGDQLVVVVENKIAPAESHQAEEVHIPGISGGDLVHPEWPDVLEDFYRLHDGGLVAGAEAGVLGDFIDYVDRYFTALGPFRTLALCKGDAGRQLRRIGHILGEALGRDTERRRGTRSMSAEAAAGVLVGRKMMLALSEDGASIELSLFPADQLGMADKFYACPKAVAGLRALVAEDGWDAKPHFQFGYSWAHVFETCNDIALDQYLDFWVERPTSTRSFPRPQWESSEWRVFWNELLQAKIVCREDGLTFEDRFVKSEKSSAIPKPGIRLVRRWRVAEAERLDDRGEFVEEVKAAVDRALTALGESPAEPSPQAEEL